MEFSAICKLIRIGGIEKKAEVEETAFIPSALPLASHMGMFIIPEGSF